MKNILILFILLVSLLFSCKDSKIDDAYITMEDLPAASYMKENPDKYSLWVDLLEYTDMFNTLNVNAKYTCFVPNNDAMSAFLASKNATSVRSLDMEYAKTIVKYHTIAGSKLYTQSEFLIGDIPDTTATGDKLSIEIREGGINAIYVNSEANIIKVDILVTNAVIHTLGKVLTPVTETVWDKINNASDYLIFKSAVQSTGFDVILANNVNKFTLFAVPDSIYKMNGILNFDSLVSYLIAGNDYLNSTNNLNKYVAYHLLSQQMSYNELSSFSDNTRSKNINTMAENELINIKDVSGTLLINYTTASGKGVDLIKLNTKCKNGIIHSVNQIMPVTVPQIATILWEFTDYGELANIFKSAYRITTFSSPTLNSIKDGAVTCYSWQSVPDYNKSYVVYYYTSEAGTSERSKAKNQDYLVLDKIGIYGWIQMRTPVILKGSYVMKLAYYSPNASKTSGNILFILDGKTIGSQISTIGNSSTSATYINNKTISTVTFDATSSHTLRILAVDKSTVYLDYITFEQVN